MKATENIEHLLLDFPKAAESLDISVSFLHTLDNSGRIVAPLKIGSRRLFSVEALKKWIDLKCPTRLEMSMQEDAK